MFKHVLTIAIIAFSFNNMVGQTDAERQQITSEYDQDAIKKAKTFIQNMSDENNRKVEDYLISHPNIEKLKVVNDEFVWLERIDRYGNPVFIISYNFLGARTIGVQHLYNGGSLGLNIEGQNITAGIWDGGLVRNTHVDLLGRVSFGEVDKALSNHGTHVGGTIIGDGVSGVQFKGMAPQGSLLSFRFDDDGSEMFTEASKGMLVSNHSYGRLVDDSTPNEVFGKYEETASAFDLIANIYPFYLPVISAGNDRNDGLNTKDFGYDLLTDRTLAKNVMTVGAVRGLFSYTGPDSVEMSSFSSWGPTDDGRIKPDLVANGVQVNSLSSSSDVATTVMSGTSMSAPMVTGGLMLLQQLFNEQESKFMRSATLKGLALMTTKEAGETAGPDYRFGWGLLDVQAAAKMILANNESSTFIENSFASGDSYQGTFVTKNTEMVSFALSWTDRVGTKPGPDEDDPTPALINDLDIKVTAQDGTEYFPYKLDVANPEVAATTGINSVDNIEIIKINAPAGDYTVAITHKGTLLGNQAYSLLVNGATPKTASSRSNEIESLSIFPNPASDAFNITFSDGIDGDQVWVEVYNAIGQQVINKQFNNSGNFNQSINISNLSSGMYLVKIGDGTVSSTRKLIVK